MVSLKPIKLGGTNDYNLSRVYFYVPTSVNFTITSATKYAVFSIGGGKLPIVYNGSVTITPENQSVIACDNADLYLDSFSINIGINDPKIYPDYGKGIEVDSRFRIYKNGVEVFGQILSTVKKGAYANSISVNEPFANDDLICFVFDLTGTPPITVPSIYLNLILLFQYAAV